MRGPTVIDVSGNTSNLYERVIPSQEVISKIRPLNAGLNVFWQGVDRVFNCLDALPVITVISSPCRIVVGLIQAIIVPLFAMIAYAAIYCCTEEKVWEHELEDLQRLAFSHVVHGGLNIGRGWVETIFASTVVGCLPMLFYECMKGDYFRPTFSYQYESISDTSKRFGKMLRKLGSVGV